MMAVSDPDAGKVLAVPRRSAKARMEQASIPAAALAFSSNGEGTLTVVQNKSGRWIVVETATTQRGARTMAVDLKTHNLYLPSAQYGPTPAATAKTAASRDPAGYFRDRRDGAINQDLRQRSGSVFEDSEIVILHRDISRNIIRLQVSSPIANQGGNCYIC